MQRTRPRLCMSLGMQHDVREWYACGKPYVFRSLVAFIGVCTGRLIEKALPNDSAAKPAQIRSALTAARVLQNLRPIEGSSKRGAMLSAVGGGLGSLRSRTASSAEIASFAEMRGSQRKEKSIQREMTEKSIQREMTE
eukprot:1821013-Pleurochrysis_carterae.AAC.3